MVRISNARAIAALDALVDGMDVDDPILRVYTGSAPTNVEDAATGTLLATVALNTTAAFGAASDANPGAVCSLQSVSLSDNSIDATGTAGYFRIWNAAASTAYIQGSVGTSATDMIVNSVEFQTGATFTITSLTLTLPKT